MTTDQRNILAVQKRNNKKGREDLVLKHVNLGDHRHLFLDVAVNRKFGGNHLAYVSRNARALHDAQPDRILESTARTKVGRYRAGYVSLKPQAPAEPGGEVGGRGVRGGQGPEARRAPPLAHKLKGGAHMEPSRPERQPTPQEVGRSAQKRPFANIFQN